MEAAMFETVAGPASVPTGVFLVETAEGLAVDWTGPKERPWGPPSPGPVLEAFVGIASHPEPGEAVRAFVLDYGMLCLCREHRQDYYRLEHEACTRLQPEPVALWLDYAREVRAALHVKARLQEGKPPDPFGVMAEETPGGRRNWTMEIERARRAGLLSPEGARELLDMVASLGEVGEEKAREVATLRKALRALLPGSREEWEGWLVSWVNRRLYDFPVTLRLARDPHGVLRPTMAGPVSILARVWIELLEEVCGTGTFAFCSHCARAYRVNRRPKTGQRRFCPECRAASVPKRLHMRDKRSRR
jgi:hypothetical protein